MDHLKLIRNSCAFDAVSTRVESHCRSYMYTRDAARTYLRYLAPTGRRAGLAPHHNIHQRAAGTSDRGSRPTRHGSIQFYHLFAAGVYDGLRLLHLLPGSFSVEATRLLAAGELQTGQA
jgi:hypothetical protein